MKKIILSAFALIGFISMNAQAPVPTSWDCTDVNNMPTGWSYGFNSGGYAPSNYTQLGVGGSASVKLNQTGQYIQIWLAAEAGEFTYYIKGTNPPNSGSPFDGQIDIQVSDDGLSWTTKRSLIDTDVNVNTITMYSDTVNPSSRYIRIFQTRKESGFNVSLDDITVGEPLPKPQAEIEVEESNTTVFDDGNLYISENVSSTKRVNIIVYNLGTDSSLNISSVTSSNTSEYTVAGYPSSVPALSSDTIKVDFTPSALGTIMTDLVINNNDSDEGTYTIHITGYGDHLATEPATQGTNFAVVNNKSFRHYITFAPTMDAEGYIILRKKGSAITATPTDGMWYSIGDMIGDAKVGYIGDMTSYRANQVFANEAHHYAIFAYNGFGQYTNYNATTPLTGIVNTSASMMPSNYYQSVSTADATFVTDLHNLVNPHTLAYYSDFDDTYIREFAAIDTTGGQKAILGHYTGDYYIYSEPFGFGTISREHSFPQSWMPTYGDETKPEYSDYHNLYPVFQNEANGVRSNNPLGVVVNVVSSHIDGKYGTDANGNSVYEPRDEQKGNSARSIFYQSIAYHGVSGNDWSLPNPIDPIFVPYGQDQDVLKQWHWQDPVDNFEIARNDYIDSIQGNRNPFIDSMNYVCFINFDNMTRVATSAPCTSTPDNSGVNENSIIKGIHYYPVPTKDNLTIELNLLNATNTTIKVYDMTGKEVLSSNNHRFNFGQNKTSINIENLSSGIYNITIFAEEESTSFKINKH